jgi:hypothetical protein
MKLLSYNGGYIGYSASLNGAKPPYDEANISTITDWTVDEPEVKKTNNIHIVGRDTYKNLASTILYVTKLSGGFNSQTSDDGAGKNYIKKGDVIVCLAFADSYSAAIHNSASSFLPRYWNGSSFTNFTGINTRIGITDANAYFSYFMATHDSSNLNNTGFVLDGGTASATGQYNILYNVIVIRGLAANANLNSLAGTVSAGFSTGTTGLPTNTNAIYIPPAAVQGVAENWIVVTGWTVDDDLVVSGSIQAYPADFQVNDSVGSQAAGGTAGIVATMVTNSSSSSSVVQYSPQIKFYAGSYGSTTLASDGWNSFMFAFKAGVEVQAKVMPKNSGIWNLTAYTTKPPQSVWYKDQFPKYFSYWQYNYTMLKAAMTSNNIFLNDTRATFVNSNYYDIVNPSGNTTFEMSVLRMDLQSLAYQYTGYYYLINRLYLQQPCRIRFRMGVYGNNNSTYGQLSVYKDGSNNTLLTTPTTYSPASPGLTLSQYSNYYTCTAPEYLKLLITFQNVFNAGNSQYPFAYALAEVTILNV